MSFLTKMKLPGFLYFARFFLIFLPKILIFPTKYIENICRIPTKKEFCQNHVWFLSYVKFSDFKYEKCALLKLVFRGQRTKIFFGANHRKSPNFMGNNMVQVSPGLGGGVHGNPSWLPDYYNYSLNKMFRLKSISFL